MPKGVPYDNSVKAIITHEGCHIRTETFFNYSFLQMHREGYHAAVALYGIPRCGAYTADDYEDQTDITIKNLIKRHLKEK